MATSGVATLRVVELAPRMRVAGDLDDLALRGQVDAVVAAERIRLQVALEAGEETLRSVTATVRRVVKHVGGDGSLRHSLAPWAHWEQLAVIDFTTVEVCSSDR